MPRLRNALLALAFVPLAGPGALAQTPEAPGPDAPAAEAPDTTGATSPDGEPGPLRIEITEGVIAPTDIALAAFHDEGGAGALTGMIQQVIGADLARTGLFREIPQGAHLDDRAGFDDPVRWQSWRAIHAEALVTGAVSLSDGRVTLKFRLYDVVTGQPLGHGMRFDAGEGEWRRLAHKAADQIYARLTGEAPYFDSRIVFVAESGPPDHRVKRLAVMDHDGAGLRELTDGRDLVLAPQIAPDGRRVVYTSFAGGVPRIALLSLETGRSQLLQTAPGTMSFAPRWSPDGRWIVYSQERAGDTNLWLMDAATGAARPLTQGPAIDTSPDFAPDGRRIVFESDRSGSPQLYVMSLDETEPTGLAGSLSAIPVARRISFGAGRYGTPVWSPRGDLIAFSYQPPKRAGAVAPDGPGRVDASGGRAAPVLQIGVMRPDGSDERILTRSSLDEGPSWSPNGRVLVFTRQIGDGTAGGRLYSVDVTGRNLRPIEMSEAASDPDWGPLLR